MGMRDDGRLPLPRVQPPADLGAPFDPAARAAPAPFIATAVFRRTGHKYRDRAYRYVLADAGRVAATSVAVTRRPFRSNVRRTV